MKVAGFEFAEGARFQAGVKADAAIVGAHLEMLRKNAEGELTPEVVLDDAQHDNSPLHPFFEWDDSAAARQHRLAQARGLIRAVVAIYAPDDAPAVRQRAYVHIRSAETPHYREVSEAMSEKGMREAVLKRALDELTAWQRRYSDLKEFADMFEAVDQIALKFKN